MLAIVRGAPMAARGGPMGKLVLPAHGFNVKVSCCCVFLGAAFTDALSSHRYTNAVMCACDHMGDVSVADARMDITTSSYGRPLVGQLQKRLLLLVSANSLRRRRLGDRYKKSTADLMCGVHSPGCAGSYLHDLCV